ncbi:MAG: S-layer homology domain-containing protein [Candidatus Microthrix sp.]|uniref:S-layer homology domain-containing protein n=1 Tax=Candidatus Neomicrothrix sp. TaxID=2719034 RepID=UPI002A7678D2|nr:S-layer homology domain-containing protein [Candidatus Microthrix sp.]
MPVKSHGSRWPSSLDQRHELPRPPRLCLTTDVPTNSYYSTAVSWLIEAASPAAPPGKYSPNAKVTRAQMAVFPESQHLRPHHRLTPAPSAPPSSKQQP